MKTKMKFACAGLTALSILGATSLAGASSHREAPAISLDPAADNTDVYAWVSKGTHDKLYIVANYNPLEEPSGGPNFHKFDDDVRYEVHLARGPDSLDDVVTYEIYFETKPLKRVKDKDIAFNEDLFNGIQFFAQIASKPPQQTYTVLKRIPGVKDPITLISGAPVAPVNIGPRTDAVVYQPKSGKYDDEFAATFIKPTSEGGRVFAGPRDDGFYVDLGGAFDLANITGGRAKPVDGVSGYNVHSIVLEIPTETLTPSGKAPKAGPSDAQTLGVWASASRRAFNIMDVTGSVDFGHWVQISRLGLPLVDEVIIGLQDKDRWNRLRPKDDLANFAAYFLHPTIVKNAKVVGIYDELHVDDATVEFLKHGKDGAGRTDIVTAINLTNFGGPNTHNIKSIGDVLRVDMGIDSAFPNGRPLIDGAKPNQEQNDVTDTLLTLLLAADSGIIVSDHVQSNDKPFLASMPFLPLPWQGFDEGHGKPAP